MQNNTEVQKKRLYRRFTNISLLVFGVLMTVSGLYIQIRYHMQGGGTLGLSQWTFIHKWSALIFTLLIVAHIALHLKWFEIILEKHLFKQNRITIILAITMLVVAILGFLPWFLTLFPSQIDLRNTLIEIHDKIGLFFIIIMFGHIIKRCRWYLNMR